MGSLLHPTGSESPQVYWRRRVVVVVLPLVLVVALIWAVWPKNEPPAQPPTATPSVSAVVEASSSASAAVTAVSASPSPSGPQACVAPDLKVTLAGYQKVKQGSNQPFKVSIGNAGTAACILSVTAKTFTLTVTSGTDRIWSTADCAKWVPTKKQTLKPQGNYEFDITWELVRSKAKCKTGTAPVKAGTYVAKASLSSAEDARLVMAVVEG